MLGPSDVTAILKASADWNAALVKDVSGQIQRQVSNIVFSGFQSKTSVYEVAKEISKTTGIARRRARNIAYDQINKLGAALNRARREQAGIDSYIWTHSAKLHARPTHLARNGMIFKNDDPRIPKGDRCSEPPFCGCHERAVIPARQEVAA
jgi:SPP1 gp7 family putative phage head morphogenesis protein